MPEFVHLHLHSEYSLRQGAIRISDCIGEAVNLGMPAVAMTDTNALYGAVRFYREAKAAGIKPIIGAQLSVAKAPLQEDNTTLRIAQIPLDTAVFLAETYTGYENLVQLITLAQSRNRLPYVTLEELANHANGLIALIAGGESLILHHFSEGRDKEAEVWLDLWCKAWPMTHLYIDVQDHGIPSERQGLPSLIRTARRLQIPLVATNDVHYLRQEDAGVQRVLAQLESMSQATLLQGTQYHFTSPAEMARRFAKLPEALANTIEISERCDVELPLHQLLLPRYPTASGEPAEVVLRRAAQAGAHQRYNIVDGAIQSRLDYELQIIQQLGFADYFLVVADFIRFAHRNNISTGPGRGSAAGSLVAYCLRITDVDPIKNKLLFERFLNPHRVSWPDIDTDFEYERRGEVIQYVVERYGADHVAQIGTFGTLAARAALRDGGRVLQIDAKLIDRVARLIPSVPGMTLSRAYDEVKGIADVLNGNQAAQDLWKVAVSLEGFPRHTSVHAAGVVISPIPLSTIVPVQLGGDGTPVTQYAMEDIEQLGLIKMDFLGLRTLSLIDACAAMVEARSHAKLDWRKIPEDDQATFAMLSKGETEGCFQLESAGVKRVLRDLRPSQMEDLIAVISLYRPGPMENIPDFIAAKHKRVPIHYPHPDLKPILEDTYGVIVYQEQIMQIASLMAGFSLGQADLLRRAVGKKKRDVLTAERERFVDGCRTRGYSESDANTVYDLIVRFADYGFNRSHAAAYAVLAYRTAYLRANHLPEFTAALLSMSIGDSTKQNDYRRTAKQHGVQVLPPNVLSSEALYVVEDAKTVRTGLLAVRNVGRGAALAILAARAEKPFASLVDFLQRVNSRVCNRKAVESLLQAGAFVEFLPDRSSPEVAGQILAEAYAATDEGRQSSGLGLTFSAYSAASVAGAAKGTGWAQESTAKPGMEPVLYIRYQNQETSETLKQVKHVLGSFKGNVRVALFDKQRRKTRLLEPRWSVQLTPELISVLEDIVGLGNARIGHMPRHTAPGAEQS